MDYSTAVKGSGQAMYVATRMNLINTEWEKQVAKEYRYDDDTIFKIFKRAEQHYA